MTNYKINQLFKQADIARTTKINSRIDLRQMKRIHVQFAVGKNDPGTVMQLAAEFVEIITIDGARPALALVAQVRKSPFCLVMDVWERWMRLSDQRISAPESHPQDAREFMAVGQAVDAMVDDLPMIQRHAISRSRSLGTQVWRWPERSIEYALEDAEAALIPRMKKHIATRRYFGV